MVILDTDHLTVIQRRTEPDYSILTTRLRQAPVGEACTTIINVEEQLRGWLAVISRSKQLAREVAAYRHLHALMAFFAAIPIVEFDEPAANRFRDLQRSRLRIGTMDLKIAAIALSRGATLISRNLRDFRRVPSLTVQDWSLGN